jgi:hypothetical protein
MKRPFLILGLLLVSLLGSFAHAATGSSSVTWTRATTYVDGSALPSSAITGHKIVCTFTPTTGAAVPCTLSATSASGTATSLTTTLTYPASGGQACFQTVTTAGIDSDPSPVTAGSCKTFAPLQPSPPSNVTVTVTLALTITSDSPISVAMAPPVVSTK